MKGLDLCRGFFFETMKPIMDQYFPGLTYSAGLIGYGSDVLGYDDAVSRDHMWGPRFYLFLREENIGLGEAVFAALSEHLPCTYQGFSVNFTAPDPDDGGVQHPEFVDRGPVRPLIFIRTVDGFWEERLGTSRLTDLCPGDWLAFSEHRLLSLNAGELFADGLDMRARLTPLRYYPWEVKLYLIASSWDIIASEQAFPRRCGDCGDGIGARILCARICERLMRLCFLYRETYAPYSKWFGTAFSRLDVGGALKEALRTALSAETPEEREAHLVRAQALTAELHNESGVTPPVDFRVEGYFGRDIRVIRAERFAEAASEALRGTALEGVPLIGSMSQAGGLSNFSDDPAWIPRIRALYRGEEG